MPPLHPKVQNPIIGGAITVLVIWLAKTYLHQDVPAEVASAATIIVMFITGYQSKGEQ